MPPGLTGSQERGSGLSFVQRTNSLMRIPTRNKHPWDNGVLSGHFLAAFIRSSLYPHPSSISINPLIVIIRLHVSMSLGNRGLFNNKILTPIAWVLSGNLPLCIYEVAHLDRVTPFFSVTYCIVLVIINDYISSCVRPAD